MAEAIGVASGVLALAVFTFKSAKALHDAVSGIKNHGSKLRELNNELLSLTTVLECLEDTLTSASDAGDELKPLALPLECCGKACQGFQEAVEDCSKHSKDGKASFRGWTKLNYLGNDIDDFRRMIAGYKSTIQIALAHANFRKSTMTASALNEFKDMIEETYANLTEHLEKMNDQLRTLKPSKPTAEVNIAIEEQRSRVLEERSSALQCLKICAEVSDHLERLGSTNLEGISTQSDTFYRSLTFISNPTSARTMTLNRIFNCRQQITDAKTELESRLRDLERGLANMQPPSGSSGSASADEIRVTEMRDSIKQCLDICSSADKQTEERVNEFEDVSMGEDGQQIIVSTVGDLIRAKAIKTGDRSVQLLGQMSDQSLQQLSRDRIGALGKGTSGMGRGTDAGFRSDPDLEGGSKDQFALRYGTGRGLSSAGPKDGSSSS